MAGFDDHDDYDVDDDGDDDVDDVVRRLVDCPTQL